MLKSGKIRPARASSASADRSAGLYDRYAASLYRQALLALGDEGLAEQVVCDVIAGECGRPPRPGDHRADVSDRLAVSAYRRSQELAGGPAGGDRHPEQRPSGSVAGGVDPRGLLSGKERGALGLVLFGGLGYIQASREAALSPLDMAALLRTALHTLAAPSSGAAPG